ncbi:MAG: hypothetical protein HY678_11655 [Chloroflexi bacterium]|nr:hypothetical protein [Chloroflexota bacterium]
METNDELFGLTGAGSGTLIFKVPDSEKGEWETGCLLPGHYESGMRGALVVE